MLELADRHGSGPCVGNDVGVRPSPRALSRLFNVPLTGYFLPTMRKIRFLGFALLVFIFTVACERGYNELANKKPKVGSPQYQATESVYATTALTNVKAVAPHGKGPDGAALFVANCAACHQATGQGIPGAFPPLDGSPYAAGPNVERMASIMIYGLQGPIHVKGALFNNVMAPLGRLGDDELAAIASYVRSAWSNKADPVEPDLFAKMRSKWGSRALFTIQELGEEN